MKKSEVVFLPSIAPQSASATVTGAAVDVTIGNAATIVFDIGVTGGTLSSTNKITLSVKESDDGSSYTSVADGDLVGTLPVITSNDDDNAVYSVGYIGTKKYLKCVATWGGTHTTPVSAGVIVGSLFVGK